MDQLLQQAVRQRMAADGQLGEMARGMLMAACLDLPLDDPPVDWPSSEDANLPTTTASAGIFLSDVAVQGFRGIGPRAPVTLNPGPGLTLIVGRNGSGKSSFAEGLEMALTGESSRWKGKPKAWSETWRNLHEPTPSQVEVTVTGLRHTPAVITHRWPDDGKDVTAGTSTLDDGRPTTQLGWDTALTRYRPMLSFNELGGMFDGKPSELYDAIAAILGVDDLRDAVERLRQARLTNEAPMKQVTKARPALIDQLRASPDERAQTILAALDAKKWDLDGAEAAASQDSADQTSQIARLRALASFESPHPVDAGSAATALRDAHAQHAEAASTDSGRADRLASLLEAAVACVAHDGAQACPLCGSGIRLDPVWQVTAQDEISALKAQSLAMRTADAALRGARANARKLLTTPPDILDSASFVGLDSGPSSTAWSQLVDHSPDDNDALKMADHLERAVAELSTATDALKAAAAEELDRLADDWRPTATAVTRWVAEARDARKADITAKTIKTAEAWLAATASTIEAERFDPIKQSVQQLWDRLRLSSNVALDDLTMYRAGASRRLNLDVSVDDSGASALGVMSQGELHALALSVFLPRATLDDSPFRFVVIDDPVQAMDPARVDGLAQVLNDVAADRQVVVLTHDTRLPDAVRRLQIPATVLEVQRQPRSRVVVRKTDDPVTAYLSDARAMAHAEGLSPGARARVVAQMGRGALEAVSMQVIRRRRLERGDEHMAVEALLQDKKVHDLVALAMFDDEGRGGDVLATLRTWDPGFPAVLQDCKRGTHIGERQIDDATFVKQVDGLSRRLRQGVLA